MAWMVDALLVTGTGTGHWLLTLTGQFALNTCTGASFFFCHGRGSVAAVPGDAPGRSLRGRRSFVWWNDWPMLTRGSHGERDSFL